MLYKGRQTHGVYRVDMIVADQVLLELKSVEKLMPIHEAQLLTYRCITGKRLGLLINFHTSYLRESISRRVL